MTTPSDPSPVLTVVLDDDPTGTQSASGATVLLDWDGDALRDTLRLHGSVYLQTNSRSLDQSAAVELARLTRAEILAAEQALGRRVSVVLRGDSTLRGHTFSETAVFSDGSRPVLFVPAFPAGGRTTIDSIHRVVIDGVDVPVGETEFAHDPVFGFATSDLREYVAAGGMRPVPVSLQRLRETGGSAVADTLTTASADDWVIPDAITDDDIRLIHHGLVKAAKRRDIVTRSAAPLAAHCAGVFSTGLLRPPLHVPAGPVLVICGSHTAAATRQLADVAATSGWHATVVDSELAFDDPEAAADRVIDAARAALQHDGIAIISTDRVRRAEHDTLEHGERIMGALAIATRELAPHAAVIVSKGGITAAEVARVGLGATYARVRGQVFDGVSLWDYPADPLGRVQIVIPGNVGGPGMISDVLAALPQRAARATS